MAVYGIVRTDNMAGTKLNSFQISAKYLPSATPTAIDNGSVVKIGALVNGETNVFTADTPAANTPFGQVALVASVELSDDPRVRLLSDFQNAAGDVLRCYKFNSGDIFSVSIAALDGDSSPDVGDVVELKAGVSLNVADSLTSESTKIGDIIAKDTVAGVDMYVIKVV
jgi:hypothetical protein